MVKFFFLLLLIIFISTCNSKGDGSDGEYQLTFWSANNSFEIEHAREIVSKWNDLYPDIKVKYQPVPGGRSSEEVILAAIVSESTPDIYSNIWPGVMQQYVEADIMVKLDDFSDFDSLYNVRVPSSLHDKFRSKDGGIYQLPWKCNPIVIYYNKHMFESQGIEAPLRTYSDFFEAAEKLTVDKDGDGYYDQWMMDVDINIEWWHRFFDFYTMFIAASGGKTFIDEDGSIAFDSQAGIQVFDFLRDGYEKGYFPNAFFQGDVFLQQKVAVHISGPWNIAHLERYKDEDFEYGFMPMPVPDDYTGGNFTYGDPKCVGIFKTSKNPEAAWKFMKFMLSEQADKRLLEITNQLPVRKNISNNENYVDYFEKHPQYYFFAEMIPNIVSVDQSIYLQEMFDIISQEFDAACVQRLKSSREGIKYAADRCRSLIEMEEL
ncbi:MAG: extracellular solute-binding protein [Candidatus Marinimicrobia bacterium]|jgi:multiple sugar transport system substrate-binding protein|nr:extracellular solute-binding protein [Candidatus Neomarinimicrobiota bacterium]MBT4852839.1 extracellular solute-binding protein [Candidatus Neomarinimicrobiota bacterium]MBT6217656.1 extracellular solute-binding protein [Candidatus Neomarinimicrobiota bacterium]